ncbi:deoxycytidylate deaminase [Pseudoalteromonas sp. S4498]|uniref:anti-phage dCTP deaminase n=1 Tax=Pseudoalteromonas galatheae TaxID=579562 RepID=UPI001107D17D|nr:anti-phage dCTP deaminase [Pseudoalteromonas galatheae]NKC20031.1 deoxycytidylate deaminase [Pseudoalteromonas galatheae]
MAETATKISPLSQSSTSSDKNDNPLDAIKGRRSEELIIGLCGTVGSGVRNLKKLLEGKLIDSGYVVEHIRLSELISQHYNGPEDLTNKRGYERYNTLQNAGDQLRLDHRTSILAELAVRRITVLRQKNFGDDDSDEVVKVTKKAAYIIDQLKHPDEINLLREIYRNNFYLLGLLRTEFDRRESLKGEQMSDAEAGLLIDRDRKSEPHGQQVGKSLHKADYFIRNADSNQDMGESITRFIKLIHGTNHITPTKDEVGIYSAFSASLKSACLSRQVGAAIADKDGDIVSTGCNDVPKFGGGLYNAESKDDNRCFNHRGYCHNDWHKDALRVEIEDILNAHNVMNYTEVAHKIIKESKAKSLIEYSRAIHAEMDAIMALARSSNSSTLGKTLYCTTYPCHVCARHIVAAGIERVVYIEPYEKSLATQLHSDAISNHDSTSSANKVLMENFEGVSPIRYPKFFGYNQQRKNGAGDVINYFTQDSGHVDFQQLDGYSDYELKTVEKVNQVLPDFQ